MVEVISEDATGTLGDDVAARFGTALPYLLKVIAAESPLSLQAFTRLLRPETRPIAVEVAEVAAACAARLAESSPSSRADSTVLRMEECFPGEPGVVTSLLLNPVTLLPGEALFVPAGGMHAYLSGSGWRSWPRRTTCCGPA